MTTPAKVEANRRNATKSTGPRTDAGKGMACYNAVRHGALTAAPVLPGEDIAAWDQHNAGVVDSLAPVGALEVALARRVALVLWRLGRLARAEALATAADLAEVLLPNPPGAYESETPQAKLNAEIRKAENRLDELKFDWQNLVRAARCLGALPAAADADPVRGAALAVRAAWKVMSYHVSDQKRLPCKPRKIAGMARGEKWTAGRVRHALAALAASAGNVKGVLEWLTGATRTSQLSKARGVRAEWEAERERAAGLIERERTAPARRLAAAMLPPVKRGELMIRYESHLQKQLTTTLHELERWQALRLGRAVVPPAAVDVTVSGAGEG